VKSRGLSVGKYGQSKVGETPFIAQLDEPDLREYHSPSLSIITQFSMGRYPLKHYNTIKVQPLPVKF
jgi:hypothetical protein